MGGTPFRSISTESDQNFSYILCLDENCQNLCFIKKRWGGGNFVWKQLYPWCLKADTYEGLCSRVILHDWYRLWAQSVGACNIYGTHEGVFSSLFNLPRDLAPRYLTSLMLCSILQGKNSAPENESRSWNRWHTRRSFAPGACPGAKPVVCVSLIKFWLKLADWHLR